MKNVFGVLLFCSLGFSNIRTKIDQGYPAIRSDKISVGKSVFKNGFFAVDRTAEKLTAAEIQVDPTNLRLTVKWYQIQTLTVQNAKLRQMLSTRQTGLPLTSIVNPVLDLGSNNINRNPFYTPQFSFTGKQVQATKDPFIPSHEEQYICRPDKHACFQVSTKSTPDSKVSITSSGDGSTLSFSTDYEYSYIERHQIIGCDYRYPCLNSSPEKLQYRPVVFTEINLSQIYQGYLTHLTDVIDRTLFDHTFVLSKMNEVVAAGKVCQYNLSMQVESRLTSEMIEDIRGSGIDENCLKTELSTLRSQFSPQEMRGFIFSDEQLELSKSLHEIEKNCPFETWVGPRNRYKLLKKDCVAAGIQRLESKTRKIQNELLRYTK